MKVCLVSAFTIPDFIDPELTMEAVPIETRIPLGILSIAAILLEQGLSSEIVDLDQLFYDFIRRTGAPEEKPDFAAFVTNHLASLSFDLLGFSSICSSYPLTVRLAEKIKKIFPDKPIALGGPQASIVDVPTLANFPSIDFIVRQEADDTFPRLLKALGGSSSEDLESIPGLTFQRRGRVIRNRDAPVIADLDRLPLPAFHLLPPKERRTVPLEIGRGCPFRCTFCSTSKFFGRRFRLKSPGKMLEHMRAVNAAYGIGSFSLDHDMFTANRRRVLEFCEALLASGEGFKWTCSARTDCVDDELIALMAQAGCTGIFFGIETGSPRLQHIIRKKLDLQEAQKRIACASRHQVSTALAFILGFPDETKQDLRDTVHYYADSLRFDYAEPQISLLAPLAGTPLHLLHKDRLTFDQIISNISHQGWRMDPEDLELIKIYPEIFPNFYAIPSLELDRAYFQEVEDFLTYIALWFRWLMVILLYDSGDLLKVFERWKLWFKDKYPDGPVLEKPDIPYLNQGQFPRDFLDFIRQCYLPEMAGSSAVISAFIESAGVLKTSEPKRTIKDLQEREHLAPAVFPYQAPGVWLTRFDVDYAELLRCLRNRESIAQVPLRTVDVIFQRIHKELIKVHQINSLSAELWQSCCGTRTVQELADYFSGLHQGEFNGIPADQACIYALDLLREQGLIGISAAPVEYIDTDPAGRENPAPPA